VLRMSVSKAGVTRFLDVKGCETDGGRLLATGS